MVTEKPIESGAAASDRLSKPEEPRLGILHLMVWIACVAVYLGLQRWQFIEVAWMDVPTGLLWVILGTLEGIGFGTALAGPVLWAVRRWRGIRFPRHPGEYLLVVLGLTVAVSFGSGFFSCWGFVPGQGLRLLAAGIADLGLRGLILLWPVWAVKNLKWRMFFVLLLVEPFADAVMSWSLTPAVGPYDPSRILFARMGLIGAVGAVLGIVVLKDHFDGKRYPWTHWVGVGVQLWLTVLAVAGNVAIIHIMCSDFPA